MAAQISAAAAKIILSWYKAAGASEEHLNMINGCLSDAVNPNVLIDGQLFRFANGIPSGHCLTVQFNSICNSIMMRYVYYKLMPNIKQSFADNIRLATFGDDNAMGVKSHCHWFTHTACQKVFEDLDLEYTMADKKSDSQAYITIDEISFLKRKFTYHVDLNAIVAPIERDSILKRFHWLKKPDETPLNFEEQFSAYADGAFREMCLFGEEQYNDFITKMENIVSLNDSLKGFVIFIPYKEMVEILSPDYSPDYKPNNNNHLKFQNFWSEDCDCGEVIEELEE
jgi:hypothetical protein